MDGYGSGALALNSLIPQISQTSDLSQLIGKGIPAKRVQSSAFSHLVLKRVLGISLPPLDRLCLLNKSPYGLRLLSVVYREYHAAKLGHRELVDYCIALDNFVVIHDSILPILREMWARM